jgi:hypothetical protein
MRKRLFRNPHLLVAKKEKRPQKGDSATYPKSFFCDSCEAPVAFLSSILTELGLNAKDIMTSYSPCIGKNVSERE